MTTFGEQVRHVVIGDEAGVTIRDEFLCRLGVAITKKELVIGAHMKFSGHPRRPVLAELSKRDARADTHECPHSHIGLGKELCGQHTERHTYGYASTLPRLNRTDAACDDLAEAELSGICNTVVDVVELSSIEQVGCDNINRALFLNLITEVAKARGRSEY